MHPVQTKIYAAITGAIHEASAWLSMLVLQIMKFPCDCTAWDLSRSKTRLSYNEGGGRGVKQKNSWLNQNDHLNEIW